MFGFESDEYFRGLEEDYLDDIYDDTELEESDELDRYWQTMDECEQSIKELSAQYGQDTLLKMMLLLWFSEEELKDEMYYYRVEYGRLQNYNQAIQEWEDVDPYETEDCINHARKVLNG